MFSNELLYLVELLQHLSATENRNDRPKPPFCIQKFSSHCLFKLTSASLLTNSCPKQKKKCQVTKVRYFYVLLCLPSFACVSSLWFYVTAGMKICDHLQYKLARGSHVFFSVKKINLAYGAFALR